MTVESTCIVLASRPKGRPNADNFRTEQRPVPALKEGDVLLEVRYLSLDPYMRGRMSDAPSYVPPLEIGEVMCGGTVCRVLQSRHAGFEEGDDVLSYSGWQTHAIAEGKSLRKLDANEVPVTTALGVLGMPGFTAWSGLRNIGKPRAGDTVVVAAATGPVGSAVGQIARLHGARAVGIAGGARKCDLLADTFGFDAAVDHRSPNFADDLRRACPDGIDLYFENVGGPVWDAVFPLLNPFARVPVCGLVANYNDDGPVQGADRLPAMMNKVLKKSLNIRGFIQHEFSEQQVDFLEEMSDWVAGERVRYLEDVVDGLESAPEAFAGLLEGKNLGKLVVRVTG